MQINEFDTIFCDEFRKENIQRVWDRKAPAIERDISKLRGYWVDNWEETAPMLFQNFVTNTLPRWHAATRIEGLERELLLLKQRVSKLERSSPVCVPIETFAPEPYELVKPFNVVLQSRDDEYIASFFDANLSASGATEVEAIQNLKDIILGVFDCLLEHDEAELGPEPSRQLLVLKTFINKKT